MEIEVDGRSGGSGADSANQVGRGRIGARSNETGVDARLALLRAYYWATPLFFMADSIWGVSVRASFLPRFDVRLVYYCFCLGCAVICHRRPGMAPFVGVIESGVNLLLIALGVLLPIWGASEAVLAGGDIPPVITAAGLVNVLLSGSILILAFHRSQHRLAAQFGLSMPGRWR